MSFTKLEDVRQEVIGAFKGVHDAHYPATKVNYPNFVVVDLEHQVDPFVSVALDLSLASRAAIGDNEMIVPGLLLVYYYFREGTGSAGSFGYTDMLNQYLCMQQIGSIAYGAAKPMSIRSFPVWDGLLNYIKFDICSTVCV